MCFFIQDQQWTCWSVGEMMKKLEGGQKCFYMVVGNCMSIELLPRCCKPVFAEADHAAVVLIASPLIQHAGVDDVSDWNIQVVSAQMLQQIQCLVLC